MFRRIPIVLAMHKYIPEIEHFQQAAFVGFFGPIGVSAIFYLYVSVDFLNNVTVDGTPEGAIREDARRLQEVMRVVIWFLAICSIVVHGLSVPLGKLGYKLPRTMSGMLTPSSEVEEPDIPFRVRENVHQVGSTQKTGKIRQRRNPNERPQNAIFRVGGSVIRSRPGSGAATPNDDEPERPIRFVADTNSGVQSPVESPRKVEIRSPEDLRPWQENSAVPRRKESIAGRSSGETAVTSSGEVPNSSPGADIGDEQ